MKQFKQLAALFLAFVMVIGIMAVPTTAYAATASAIAKSDITINYAEQQIEVTAPSGATVIYYTDKADAKTIVWEEASVSSNKAIIDFSYTAAAKDVTFAVTEDKAKTPVNVEIKAQETKFMVALSGTAKTVTGSKLGVQDLTAVNNVMTAVNGASNWEYGYLFFYIKDGSEIKALDASAVSTAVQYKKGATGAWKNISTLNLKTFAAKGAQLYFRLNGVVSGSSIVDGRSSKEVKVAYTKQANAPKVKIDGATTKITLTKTQEYRVSTNNGTSWGEWVKVADLHMDDAGKKVDTIYLKDLSTKAATSAAWSYSPNNANQKIQVRIAGTDKKIASKIATVSLVQATTPTVSTASGISFGLVKATSYDNGITVTNNNVATGASIQVAVVSGSSFDVNAKTTKWTTVKPGKTAVIKGTALDAGDRIIYRTATIKANAKTGDVFTVASEVGTLLKTNYPALTTQTVVAASTVTAKYDTGITVATASSITTSGDVSTVKAVKAASASSITVTLDLTTTNVAAGVSPKVTCVTAANSTATTSTDKKGVTVTAAKVASDKSTVTIKIPKTASESTTTWKVVVDSVTKYIVVEYK